MDDPMTLYAERLLAGLKWMRESLEPECRECGAASGGPPYCESCYREFGEGE